jgi:uncharacterized protein
LITGASEGIGK